MTEAERMAAGLTQPQARFLNGRGAGARAGHSLWKLGLLRPYDNKTWQVTDLGLAVRKVLERSNDTD